MADYHLPDWRAVADLRALASQGRLVEAAGSVAPTQRSYLTGAAFALAWPIVFDRITRVNEHRRGHHLCATGLDRLADDCLDRFYDDVEAVVEDLLAHATTEIGNLEGWIASRLRAVTIDAHRRRRGARGALQRPRLPVWLIERLPDGVWFEHLAVQILVWVGLPNNAGAQLWPLDAWAEQRAVVTGDRPGSDPHTVLREVDQVLAQMRRRPRWYADYVERPLGAKTVPVASSLVENGSDAWPRPMMLTESDQAIEARLAELASLALIAIEKQLADDPQDEAAVSRIITTVFGRLQTTGEFAQTPDHLGDHIVTALIDNPEELSRVVQAVRGIVADGRLGA